MPLLMELRPGQERANIRLSGLDFPLNRQLYELFHTKDLLSKPTYLPIYANIDKAQT